MSSDAGGRLEVKGKTGHPPAVIIICSLAFCVAAPQAWNRLPTELKLLRSTDSFRRDPKTFPFHSAYGHHDTDWLCDAPSVFW